MAFEQVEVKKLIPYARNARTHSREQILQLRASLREFGFVAPVLIDRDYTILAGHGRVAAAKEEELATVPCVFVEGLTEAQKKAYILADNRLAMNAGWDSEMLALEVKELQAAGFNVELTGLEMHEIEALFTVENDTATVEEDDFDTDKALEEIAEPITRRGDLWMLGKHRLLCGDSTAKEEVKTLMDSEKARFIFTDPPWNVDYGADKKHPSWKSRQILNDKMSAENFGAFLLAAFTNMAHFSEKGCMVYVAMSAQEWNNVMTAMREAGYIWASTIIWAKDSLVLSRKDYHTQYEPLWYGWLDGKKLHPPKDRKQSDLWEIPRPKVSVEHPTMKPLALVAKAITNSSAKGDIVLDLFGGSGSTLIASEQTGRICRMMELDPKYCDVIVKRYVELTDTKEGVFLMRDGKRIPYEGAVL